MNRTIIIVSTAKLLHITDFHQVGGKNTTRKWCELGANLMLWEQEQPPSRDPFTSVKNLTEVWSVSSLPS